MFRHLVMTSIRKHLGIKRKLNYRACSTQDVDTANTFGSEMMSKGDLSARKRVSMSTYAKNHRDGKLAEFCASGWLYMLGFEYIEPDTEIRSRWDRASIKHDVDLSFTDFSLHIKSCNVDSPYPESYSFDVNDPVRLAPCNDEYVMFVLLRESPDEVGVLEYAIRGILPAQDLGTLYRDPVLDRFQDTKRFIYGSELEEMAPPLRRVNYDDLD